MITSRHGSRVWLRAIGLLVILPLVSSCARPSTGSDEVRIGLLLPQSGTQAITGLKIKNGYVLAVEEINEGGGISALGGAKIRLVDADTEGSPDVGVSETERLIHREQVSLLMGCFQSSVAVPTTQLAERNGTPYLVVNPMADIITERGFTNIFRVTAKASWMARDQMRFLRELGARTGEEVRTIVLLYEDTDFGQSTADGQRQYASEFGFDVIGDLPYPHQAADLQSTILRVQALAPDVILATSYDADAVLIRRTMAELGYFPRLAFIGSTGGYVNPYFVENVGELAEGILTSSLWNPDIEEPGVHSFYEKYTERFGEEPIPQSALAYAATYVAKDALERAGSVVRDEIREALATTDLSTGGIEVLPYDHIRFGPSGQNEEAMLIMVQIQEEEYLTVWPFDMGSGEALWPAKQAN